MGKTKDDLISRQAAVKAIAENLGRILGTPPDALTGAAERWMDEIPGKEAAPEWIPYLETPSAGGDDYLVFNDGGKACCMDATPGTVQAERGLKMWPMDLDALMKKVKENKCEICLTIMPDGK